MQFTLETILTACFLFLSLSSQVEHMLSEKKILTLLSREKHPFIVDLVSTFNDDQYIYMVLDYVVGGEFFSHLRNTGILEPESASFYIAQVVLIFENLHEKGIIYRDLKPEVSTNRILTATVSV